MNIQDPTIKMLETVADMLAHAIQERQEQAELEPDASVPVNPEDAAPELDSARTLVHDAIESIKMSPL